MREAPLKDKPIEGRLISGAFSLTLSGVLAQVVNYAVHIGLGRFFAPALYGYFGIIASGFALLEVILKWGLPRALAFHIARDNELANKALKKALGLQLLYALPCFFILYAFAGQLAGLFGDPGLTPYFRFSSFFILAYALVPVFSGVLNGLGAFQKQALMGVIATSLKLAILAGLLYAGAGLYGVIAAYALSYVLAVLYGAWAVGSKLPGEKSDVGVRSIVAFGFPLFVASLAISLLMRIDLFMVHSLLGDPILTGLYNSASTLVKGPYFLSLGSGLVWFQVIARLRTANESESRNLISRAVYYYLLGLAPIPFIVYATSEEILRVVFGEAYQLAAPALTVLAFCFPFMVLYNLMTTFIAAVDRPRFSMILSLVLLPVQALLVYQLTSTAGLTGAALATTAAWTLGALGGAVYLSRHGYLTLPKLRTAVNLGLACLCTYYLVLWISPSGLWLCLILPLVYCFYLVLLGLTGEFRNGEIRFVLSALFPARRQVES